LRSSQKLSFRSINAIRSPLLRSIVTIFSVSKIFLLIYPSKGCAWFPNLELRAHATAHALIFKCSMKSVLNL
jgi:hypothetical protein